MQRSPGTLFTGRGGEAAQEEGGSGREGGGEGGRGREGVPPINPHKLSPTSGWSLLVAMALSLIVATPAFAPAPVLAPHSLKHAASAIKVRCTPLGPTCSGRARTCVAAESTDWRLIQLARAGSYPRRTVSSHAWCGLRGSAPRPHLARDMQPQTGWQLQAVSPLPGLGAAVLLQPCSGTCSLRLPSAPASRLPWADRSRLAGRLVRSPLRWTRPTPSHPWAWALNTSRGLANRCQSTWVLLRSLPPSLVASFSHGTRCHSACFIR